MSLTKICLNCKESFSKDPRIDYGSWEKRTACSRKCSDMLKVGKKINMPLRASLEDRFWKYIGIGAEVDACWTWVGAAHPAGYGLLGRGRSHEGLIRATHVMWKIITGESVPEGMIIMHTCDNPPCCNPLHLRLGTHKKNIGDMIAKGRAKYTPLRGEDNGMCILSDEQVTELRKRALDAPPRRHGRIAFWTQLAHEFGIKPRYAQQLCMQNHRYCTRTDGAI